MAGLTYTVKGYLALASKVLSVSKDEIDDKREEQWRKRKTRPHARASKA